MSCKNIEQGIYLYRELTSAERNAVDKHMESCDSCRDLLATVQQTQLLVSKEALGVPQPKNFSKLTSDIMQAISEPEKQQASWMSNLIFRYAMVAASFVLILGFGFESFPSVGQITKRYPYAKTVTLKSTSLAKSYRDKKAQPEKSSLYACAKSGDCNNTFIENFKKKSL